MRRIILLIVALLAAVPASAQNPVSVSQWKTAPVDTGNGTTTTGTLRVTITSDSTGTIAATQSGTWNITNISGTVSLPTLASTSTKQSDGSQKTQIVDGSGNVIASTSNNLNVQCANCSGSGASAADEASFTAGTSTFAPAGGFFQTTATNNPLTTGQQGMWQLTAQRAGFVNLRNASGTEIGTSSTPVQVSLANTGANSNKLLVTPDSVALPANQSVNVSQLAGTTTDTNSGNKSAGTLRVVLATDQPALTNKLLVTPDSVALPANQSVNVSQMNGVATTMGNGASGTGVQRVTIANDSTGTIIATQATGTNLHIVCDSGCSSSAGFADNAAFTYGTTAINPIGGVLDDVATNSATENSAAVARITAKKALHVNLRDNSGNEITSSVDATTNTASQSTGPQLFGNGSTATPTAVGADGRSIALWADTVGRLRIDNSTIQGTAMDVNSGNKSAGTMRVVLATDQPALTNKLLVTPDSVALPANQSVNISQINAVTPLMGNGATGTGALRVSIANDSTGVVQPGNTANTTPWLVQAVPGTAGGLTTFVLEAAASDNHTNVKNGAGTVYHITSFNNSATINYYRLYNAASGFNGCNSATNLLWEGLIPASTSGGGFVEDIAAGINFSTGISICITGAFGNTNTTNATASAILFNLGYK